MPEITVIPASKNTLATRTAAYARVSSDSEDQLNSFAAQIEHYTELLENKPDISFVDLYADEGLTGTEMEKRTEFNRMISDCRKGKIDRILTKSISRFARNTKECLETIRELKALNVSLYFEKENLDTREMTSEMLLTLYSQFAQEESISISKNVRMGVQKRMRDGTYKNPSAAFGYDYIDGKLVVNPENAKIVRRIFDEYLRGAGTSKIAASLNREKIKPPETAKQWYQQLIHEIIRNERYIGDSLFQKRYTTDFPFQKRINRGEREKIYVEDTHEAIIDREIFEKVQTLRETKSKLYFSGKPREKYPLSGIIKCRCGSSFRRKIVNGKIKWVCRSHDKNAENCSIKAICEEEIYGAFVKMFNKLAAAHKEILPPLIKTLETISEQKISANAQIATLRGQVSDLKKQLHTMFQLKAQGVIDEAYCAEKTRAFDGELLQLQRQIRALSGDNADDKAITELRTLENILESAEQITEFDELIFSEIVEKITVLSESEVRFTLRGGLELDEKIERKGR